MHKWIHTDNGIECYRCGVAVDYMADEATERAAHELIGWCDVASDPESRPHHFQVIGTDDEYGYALECAYGDQRITYTSTQIAHHSCNAP